MHKIIAVILGISVVGIAIATMTLSGGDSPASDASAQTRGEGPTGGRAARAGNRSLLTDRATPATSLPTTSSSTPRIGTYAGPLRGDPASRTERSNRPQINRPPTTTTTGAPERNNTDHERDRNRTSGRRPTPPSRGGTITPVDQPNMRVPSLTGVEQYRQRQAQYNQALGHTETTGAAASSFNPAQAGTAPSDPIHLGEGDVPVGDANNPPSLEDILGDLLGSSGSSSGDSGTTVITGSTPPSIEAVWREVSIDSTCENLEGFRSNDLYLRFDAAARVTTIDSGVSSTGIVPANGAFYQADAGRDTRPSTGAVLADPCLAFDTYVAMDDIEVLFLPTGSGVNFDPAARATWFAIGATAQQNTALFNDDAFYLHIGRFTAPTTVGSVTGSISVSYGALGATLPTNASVIIPDCADCWDGPPPPEVTDPGTDDPGEEDPGDGEDPSEEDPGEEDPGGDDPGDEDPGDDDPGDDDPETPPNSLVWLIADNGNCTEAPLEGAHDGIDLSTSTTYDLYWRTDQAHSLVTLATGDPATMAAAPILFSPAGPFQHPIGDNLPPDSGIFVAAPCVEFDSFFAFGTLTASDFIGFLPAEPPADDWGAQLEIAWFGLPSPVAQQDSATFGDDSYYVRLARITMADGATISGQLEVAYGAFGTTDLLNIVLDVPPLPAAP